MAKKKKRRTKRKVYKLKGAARKAAPKGRGIYKVIGGWCISKR